MWAGVDSPLPEVELESAPAGAREELGIPAEAGAMFRSESEEPEREPSESA